MLSRMGDGRSFHSDPRVWHRKSVRVLSQRRELRRPKALEIDDSLAEAHNALAAVLKGQDWKFSEA
jgi:hypothetical protein